MRDSGRSQIRLSDHWVRILSLLTAPERHFPADSACCAFWPIFSVLFIFKPNQTDYCTYPTPTHIFLAIFLNNEECNWFCSIIYVLYYYNTPNCTDSLEIPLECKIQNQVQLGSSPPRPQFLFKKFSFSIFKEIIYYFLKSQWYLKFHLKKPCFSVVFHHLYQF